MGGDFFKFLPPYPFNNKPHNNKNRHIKNIV